MAATVRCVTVVGLLFFSAACSDSKLPPAPTSVPPPPLQTYEPPPPLTGPSTTYVFSGPLLYPVSHWTVTTSYMVYENGAFVLRSTSGQLMVGKYTRESDNLLFDFGNFLGATGRLRGNLLEVRYVERLQMSDFEDAVYKRSQ